MLSVPGTDRQKKSAVPGIGYHKSNVVVMYMLSQLNKVQISRISSSDTFTVCLVGCSKYKLLYLESTAPGKRYKSTVPATVQTLDY
jgi:hypothetical protein